MDDYCRKIEELHKLYEDPILSSNEYFFVAILHVKYKIEKLSETNSIVKNDLKNEGNAW